MKPVNHNYFKVTMMTKVRVKWGLWFAIGNISKRLATPLLPKTQTQRKTTPMAPTSHKPNKQRKKKRCTWIVIPMVFNITGEAMTRLVGSWETEISRSCLNLHINCTTQNLVDKIDKKKHCLLYILFEWSSLAKTQQMCMFWCKYL